MSGLIEILAADGRPERTVLCRDGHPARVLPLLERAYYWGLARLRLALWENPKDLEGAIARFFRPSVAAGLILAAAPTAVDLASADLAGMPAYMYHVRPVPERQTWELTAYRYTTVYYRGRRARELLWSGYAWMLGPVPLEEVSRLLRKHGLEVQVRG